MTQIIQPIFTPRQRSFQDDLGDAISNFGSAYMGAREKNLETQRQQALNQDKFATEMIMNKQKEQLRLTPQEKAFIDKKMGTLAQGPIAETLSAPGNAVKSPTEIEDEFSMYEPKKAAELRKKAKMDDLEYRTKQVNYDKAVKEAKGLGSDGTKEDKFKQNQYQAAGFATRAEQAEKDISGLPKDIGTSFSDSLSGKLPPIMAGLRSDDIKRYRQAQENFITAVLRKESGASINDSEFSRYSGMYFPQQGDGPKELQQKAVARMQAMASLKAEAGGAYNKVKSQLDTMAPTDYMKPAPTPGSAPSGQQQNTKPKTRIQDGHTYTLNEATGEYE